MRDAAKGLFFGVGSGPLLDDGIYCGRLIGRICHVGTAMTTNYVDSFIAVSPDCLADAGTEPKPGTVPARYLEKLREQPYAFTSDELMFAVHAEKHAIAPEHMAEEFALFTAKPRACLRASDLVKRFGWGIHHDGQSKVAAFGAETPEYEALLLRADLKQVKGMRSKRR